MTSNQRVINTSPNSRAIEWTYSGIEVIDRASSDFKLRMKELLHIFKSKPTLNKQMNAQSKKEIKTLIIQEYEQHLT